MQDGLLLQAHHIIPRANRGKTIMKNLVTLCCSCHDFVEMNPQALDEILFVCGLKEKPIDNLDWHKWVYGGYKRPGD